MSLIHWWPLNGNTKDYGTKNSSITINNQPSTQYISGKIGQCYNFNGGPWMQISGVSVGKDCSICAWAKSTTNGTMLWGMQCAGSDYLNLYNSSCMCLNVGDSEDNPFRDSNGNNVPYFNDNVWHHFVVVFKGDERAKLYIDGVYRGQAVTYRNPSMNNQNFTIGTWNYSGHGYYWNGGINDVRIYDHALSAKEVKEISKGLVLHYNFEDPYAEGTTNYVPNSSTFSNWNSYGDGYTSVSDCELGGKKIVIDNKLAWCGMYAWVSLPEAGTYTISVWCKPLSRTNNSVTQTCYTSGGGISDTDCSVDWSKTGVWQRISMTRTYSTTSLTLYLIAYGGPSDGRISCEYTMPQIEKKDHATPYVNGTRANGLIYDNSGYGYNGTSYGNPEFSKDSGSGEYSLDLIASEKYIKFKSLNFITTGTVIVWAKYLSSNTSDSKMIIGDDSSTAPYLGAANSDNAWYSNSVGSITHYRDGQRNNYLIRDDKWHCYAFTGISFASGWNGNMTICYYGGYSNGYQFHGMIADIKIFNTILSETDILAEYQRKASIDKSGKLFAPYINEYETTGNIGELANYYIETQHAFDGRFGALKESDYNAYYPNGEPGLGTYEQGNLIVTMTSQGIRIYSEPNRDGRAQEGSEWNTWGGFCWSPMKQSRCLIKGHHYRLSWHVKGQSSRAMTDVYWSNQIGWGQYPDADPTVHKIVAHPADFQGEMDCFYDFTIEDDIFKTTTSDVHSGFEPNTSYLAYSAFKIGYTYGFTGSLGTDIYITNLKLYDLTTGDVYKVEKSGIIKTTELVSGRRDSARLHSDGVIDVTDIEEC